MQLEVRKMALPLVLVGVSVSRVSSIDFWPETRIVSLLSLFLRRACVNAAIKHDRASELYLPLRRFTSITKRKRSKQVKVPSR